jgi:pyruvate dehydrogenase E2 component (dihydrolipoyllysine-residue acetyltransferase)
VLAVAEFVMPTLGADMTAGRLVTWVKHPGDTVTRGDIIAEVDTDKGLIEVEVFTSGVLEKTLVEPGTKVPVGTPLAIIREAGEEPAAVSGTPAPPSVPATEVRTRVSPAARRLAAELSVDPASVHGTGPDGAVTLDDVRKTGGTVEVRADRGERMRQAIAAAVSRSKREVPHYYIGHTIDLGPVFAWLAEQNRERPVARRLVHSALLVKAVALTLRDFPELNARWVEGRAARIADINVGLAISLRDGGLVAPALHHADRLSVDELMARTLDLVERARAGALRSSELSEPTITVTILGDRGVDTVYGVIYPPQVAIVGFGTVVERPWVVDGSVVARRLVRATLAADHRVSDGHRGALFLAAMAGRLQDPARL